MFIQESIKFFVEIMDMSWWALGRVFIPGTSVNGQFIFIFTLLLTLGWKLVLQRTMPPVKVDNIEIPNSNTTGKQNQTYQSFTRKRKVSKKDLYW